MRANEPGPIAMLVGLALLASACGDDSQERAPLPDWSEGFDFSGPDQTGTLGELDAGMAPMIEDFALAIPEEVTYPIRLGRKDSAEPCAVSPGSADNDLICLLDMDELDLWVLGLQFDVQVPEGMCDFVLYEHYLYENLPVGTGPTEVSYTVEETGTVTDEVNSRGGEPYCEFDYTDLQLPNCCEGSYTLTVTDAKSGKVSVTQHRWGGEKLGACYDGGGFRYEEKKLTPDGFPPDIITYLDRQSFEDTLVYDGLSEEYPRVNVPLANFWDPEDHDGELPAPLRGRYATPYYTVSCLDDAHEIIARFRLQVREWNEEVEFGFGEDGDPDTEGEETGWEAPINDLLDWLDLDGDFPFIRRPGI